MSNGLEEMAAAFDPHVRDLASRARTLIFDVYPEVVEVPWPRQNVAGYGVGPKKMSEHFCYNHNPHHAGKEKPATLHTYSLALLLAPSLTTTTLKHYRLPNVTRWNGVRLMENFVKMKFAKSHFRDYLKSL